MPKFLKLSSDSPYEAGLSVETQDGDSLATNCLFAEMTLKNARFAPLYPLRVAASSAGRPKEFEHGKQELLREELSEEHEERTVKATVIEFLQPRSVHLVVESDPFISSGSSKPADQYS